MSGSRHDEKNKTFYDHRMQMMLKKYRTKWEDAPIREVSEEAMERCRLVNDNYSSQEDILLCNTINKIQNTVLTENKRQIFRECSTATLLRKQSLFCSPDDLGYTNDEEGCAMVREELSKRNASSC